MGAYGRIKKGVQSESGTVPLFLRLLLSCFSDMMITAGGDMMDEKLNEQIIVDDEPLVGQIDLDEMMSEIRV